MAWHDMYHEKARWLVQVKHRCLALTPPVVSHSTRWVVGSAPIYIVRGALCVYTAAVRVARCVAHHSWGSPWRRRQVSASRAVRVDLGCYTSIWKRAGRTGQIAKSHGRGLNFELRQRLGPSGLPGFHLIRVRAGLLTQPPRGVYCLSSRRAWTIQALRQAKTTQWTTTAKSQPCYIGIPGAAG